MSILIKEEIIANHNNSAIIEYQLIAKNGFQVNILNYGGIIRAIYTHDKNQQLANIIVTNSVFNPQNPGHAGAITGPIAGRIANGKFKLEDKEYQLELNNGKHSLHGGNNSLDKQIWQVSRLDDGIRLQYTTFDGESGFPGIINFVVDYRITGNNQLSLNYEATTDHETIVNLTNHSYFDLSCGRDPMGQELCVNANYFGAIDENELLFTGKLISVTDTPFDFRKPKPIRQDIDKPDAQLKLGGGYDHPFVLDSDKKIMLSDPHSHRYLEVFTTDPICVIYSANNFQPPRCAVCLETQKMPNAINLPEYKNQVIIDHTNKYISKTIWQFGVK